MSKAKPKRAPALPLVALALLLPVLAACGGSDAPSGASGAAAGGGSAGTSSDPYVKFAQCMRQNGVPDWPDPVDGTKFRMPRGKIDPNSPEFKAASQACKPLAPPGWGGESRQDPAVQAGMLKYAQCMRKNGVPDFPDPQGGALDLGNIDLDSPQFKAAEQKCQSLRPAGGGG
ncbi:hypothetical protein DPM19_12890 [Actinomadura craniellae]|uniref:Lipoprotein n=1 Tax=Actinomadura craniellae TaxID=2231787 RepID=A0A365H6A6_9ACTN|nr:hypothetical protein [Actinomadura craniellae]RAY14650.1 hypothetical protein DPM19_12890 [Actinomadura craniellae]